MITVIMKKRKNQYLGFVTSGHAEYDDPGRDIICSAVSILVLNTVNSIELLTSQAIAEEKSNAEDGFVSFSLAEPIIPEAQLFLESLKLGIEGIAGTYNTKKKLYVSLKIEEV